MLRIYQWVGKNMFLLGRIKFWKHHELERPRIKILTIWCITQEGIMSNENTSTTSLHSKQWFHEEQETNFK